MKTMYFFFLLLWAGYTANAQEDKGFKKENLFTGGSVSLTFSSGAFGAGVNPVLGYKIANWVDAGIVLNYNYTSYSDYFVNNDKLRQTIYGGGVFTRLFPVNFLFLQGQVERNQLQLKYSEPSGFSNFEEERTVNSLLVGGGYTTGRQAGRNTVFFHLAVLFDISDNEDSPYTDQRGKPTPIIRAGINIPLFQGKEKL